MITRNYNQVRRLRPARGLTLAEVLISVVIFGIGLTMVAGIFPAALKLNRRSTDDVIGTLIGQNALSVAQVRLTHQQLVDEGIDENMTRLDDMTIGGQTLISERDRTYPRPQDSSEESTMGWLLLGRKINSDDDEDNDYLLVAVAYRKRETVNTVEAIEETLVKIEDYEDVSKADFGDTLPDEVQQNGVIILQNGRHAYMVGLDRATGEAVLDRRLPEDNNLDVWLVYEKADESVTRNSPVMAVVIGRTALSNE